jgi:hypothetical protein
LWARKPAHAHKLKVSMGTSDLKVEKWAIENEPLVDNELSHLKNGDREVLIQVPGLTQVVYHVLRQESLWTTDFRVRTIGMLLNYKTQQSFSLLGALSPVQS